MSYLELCGFLLESKKKKSVKGKPQREHNLSGNIVGFMVQKAAWAPARQQQGALTAIATFKTHQWRKNEAFTFIIYCQNHNRSYVCGIRYRFPASKCKSYSSSWRERRGVLPILKRLAKVWNAAPAVCETAEASALDAFSFCVIAFVSRLFKSLTLCCLCSSRGGGGLCAGGKEHTVHLWIPPRSCWALHQLVGRVGWAGRSKNRYSRLRKINSNKWQREGRVKRACA